MSWWCGGAVVMPWVVCDLARHEVVLVYNGMSSVGSRLCVFDPRPGLWFNARAV